MVDHVAGDDSVLFIIVVPACIQVAVEVREAALDTSTRMRCPTAKELL